MIKIEITDEKLKREADSLIIEMMNMLLVGKFHKAVISAYKLSELLKQAGVVV